MQEVSDLLAAASIPDVAQVAAEVMRQHPVCEHALIDLAHLPWTRHDAAAVYDRLQPVGCAVLLDQELGGKLGGAVQRARSAQWEVLGDAVRRGAGEGL